MASDTKTKKPSKTELMKQLESTSDQATKRKLRAQLRSMGHVGGLGKKAGKPAKKAVTKTKPKGKRAATKSTEAETSGASAE